VPSSIIRDALLLKAALGEGNMKFAKEFSTHTGITIKIPRVTLIPLKWKHPNHVTDFVKFSNDYTQVNYVQDVHSFSFSDFEFSTELEEDYIFTSLTIKNMPCCGTIGIYDANQVKIKTSSSYDEKNSKYCFATYILSCSNDLERSLTDGDVLSILYTPKQNAYTFWKNDRKLKTHVFTPQKVNKCVIFVDSHSHDLRPAEISMLPKDSINEWMGKVVFDN